MQDAKAVIAHFDLAPHPEGGWFRETFRDAPGPDGRAKSTAILFLLEAGQRSHWHRVDAVETWHWHAGGPLELSIHENGATQRLVLGPDFSAGHSPQGVVPAHAWQGARPLDGWALVGCTVAPGFEFSGFVLAPPDWEPDWSPEGG